jgi:peptidoglycan-associated lipoprotein
MGREQARSRREAGASRLRHGLHVLGLVAATAVLGGCISGRGAPSAGLEAPLATATNAPVAQGVAIRPGTEEDFVVNVGRRTFFREGSAELDETARVTLDKQAGWLVRYANWKVKVQGFADDAGPSAGNIALSQRRAEAARNYLAAKGVPTDRMLAKGYGKDAERLINNCTDLSCRAQNRRVVSNLQETLEL